MSRHEMRLHVVTVAMTADGERSDLLGLASVLHRRGVDVIEADMSRPAHGRRVLSATFRATPQRATTVLRSLENLIDVVDATLFEAFDARGSHETPASRQRREAGIVSGG